MKTKLLAFCAVLCGTVTAQTVNYSYDSKEIKGLLSSTLYILPTGDKTFDDSLQAAVKRYWTITPVEAAAPNEIEGIVKDKHKYFITSMGPNGGNYAIETPQQSKPQDIMAKNIAKLEGKSKDDDIVGAAIMICKGGQFYNNIFIVASCGLPFYHKEQAMLGLDYAVKNLADDINILTTNKISINPNKHDPGEELKKFMSTNPQTLKTRTLLIPEFLTAFAYPEKVVEGYKFQYKIMPAADIASILNSPNYKDYCFVAETSEGSLQIFDPVTKTKIYSSVKETWGKIKDDDIDDLNKAVANTQKKRK